MAGQQSPSPNPKNAEEEEGQTQISNPKPPDPDLLLHIELYLARRDGIDKLLKLLRYSTKLLLSSSLPLSQTLTLNLTSFDSSLSTTRKAFRLGKFIQDLNTLRLSPFTFTSLLAYGGEGAYYFVEQFVWLAKTGLISKSYLKRLVKISAWFELVGYVGSVSLKVGELKRLGVKLEECNNLEERRVVKEKIVMKRVSVVQDLADGLMALGDVRDGKGVGTGPGLMATAGLVSGVISAHKNWKSCC